MKNIIMTLLAFYLLTGCSTLVKKEIDTAPVSKLAYWQAEGTVSIRKAHQINTFSFHWQQKEDHYTLRFFAPLGLASVLITGNPHQVTLWRSPTQKITAQTPEALMASQLGYTMPVRALSHWIRGLPDPKFPFEKTMDSQHRLSILQQQHWVIHFLDFKTFNGMRLPTRMTLVNQPLRIHIVISQWKQ